MQSIEAADLQTWERTYPNLPVPGDVNGATDAQRADAYRAAIRACLRLIFEGSLLREPGAKAWSERVWAVIQQYGVGQACDLEGASVESSGYETALYDILEWYREVAARTPPSLAVGATLASRHDVKPQI
jgi:hypothetical protein